MARKPLLEAGGITKNFGAVKALRNVDLAVYEGEILGLIGDNGAGKSTLIKIISGALTPNKGRIFFNGEEVKIRNIQDARNLGIETVYQDLALADDLDITQNFFMGRELTNAWRIVKRRTMDKETQHALRKLKIDIGLVRKKARNLSGGERQAIAVGRAFYWKAKIVIMDEPVSALGVRETSKILNLVKGLKEENISVIFISHNLYDVLSIADRVVVLKHGKKVAEKRVEETDRDELMVLM
jgi:ABC-type sugar transport system ATPase subunit